MKSASDSSAQQAAERLILDAIAHSVGVELCPRRLTLVGGAVVDVDGVAADESVLVEVFAHQGELKGGQRHKIAGVALKLITIARGRVPAPRLVLAFADPSVRHSSPARAGWPQRVIAWDIEVVVAELDDAVREGIRTAQAQQVMINPPGDG